MADHPGAEFGLSKETLENIVQTALDDAGSQGATQAEASVAVGTGLSVTVRQREVETLEYQRDRNFTVTVYLGHRKGSASTSDLSDTAVAESVRKACSIASYTAEDEYAGLADAELMAFGDQIDDRLRQPQIDRDLRRGLEIAVEHRRQLHQVGGLLHGRVDLGRRLALHLVRAERTDGRHLWPRGRHGRFA